MEKFSKRNSQFLKHVFQENHVIIANLLGMPKVGHGTKKRSFKKTTFKKKRSRKSYLNQNDVSRGPEKKSIDVTTSYTPSGGTWQGPTLINGIAQGVGNSERVGRKTVMKSVMMRSVSSTDGPFRIMIVYDKQANGATPAVTDIVDNDSFNAFQNLQNSDRFVIVADEICQGAPIGSITTVSPGAPDLSHTSCERYQKMNMEELFLGTGATITSIASGALYVMAVAHNSTAASQSHAIRTRVRYIDN